MPVPDPVTLGPYEITGVLGRSPSATVYSSVDPRAGRAVAVKVPGSRLQQDPAAVERLAAELAAAAPLAHPNIARVLDYRCGAESTYIVSELADGGDLEALMRRGRLPLAQVFRIVEQIAEALAYAHSRGVIHRRLKPRNVLLSRDQQTVKVGDFGTSSLQPLRADGGTLTTGQVNLGAIRYLAPELAGRMGQTDVKSDLFALGMVFYELLTGRLPGARVSLPSQLVPDLPSEIDPVVLKLIAQDPRHRPGSVRELLAELQRLEGTLGLRLAGELQSLTRSGPVANDGTAKPGLSPPMLATAALLALLVGGAGWLLFHRPGASAPGAPGEAPRTDSTGSEIPSEPGAQPDPGGDSAEALYQQARALLGAGRKSDPEGARKLLAELAERYPASPRAVPALMQKARIEEDRRLSEKDPELGRSVPAALLTYRDIATRYPTASSSEEALWRLAELYEAVKRYDRAAQALTDLGTRFPTTAYDAWYRAGTLYEKKLANPDQAREAYRHVPITSPSFNSARDRLAQLRP